MVLPVPMEKILTDLARVTRPVSLSVKKGETRYLFNGSVERGRFIISRKVDYPNNYIPLITGWVEDSTRGCILFLKYRLFFSSLIFLIFWSVVCILLSLFLFFMAGETTYALIALAAGATNYVVTLMNFHKQYSLSRKLLLKAIDLSG